MRVHAQEDIEDALQKRDLVVEKLYKMKLAKALKHVIESAGEVLNYMKYPGSHWKKIRANNSFKTCYP